MTQHYDTIVIGAGPGGMTAAIYTARANMKTLMIDRGIYGGQMNNTAEIENYPGYVSIQGPELAEKMYASTTALGVEYAFGNVEHVMAQDALTWRVITDMDEYTADSVILATGSQYKKLGVPGEEQYAGRGVSYCAVCDGAFFKGEHVVVVGGGDSAIEEASYLAGIADRVTVIHRRDTLRAQKILQDRAFANDKINFIWDSEVQSIIGDDTKTTAVQIKNRKTGEVSELATSGVFIYVGLLPVSEPFASLNVTDEEGWVVTNDQMETTQPGVFALGDIRQKTLRQITTAVGDAAIAGQNAYAYSENVKMAKLTAK
ncbi:thioredoxin-disulfide reductase [Weissella diestrammenae]|uniref:Thioredoxin reductase n=1 Tax=Weissella diestrammenae TaxID=1162633 RepID=A0A7G9T6B1_9LACO|nr:thioredoxin-disulfide reductase [Weissella diestrammenae]MCM0583318.1 thioredoxin-disulfide reductase [Weissella diestrammenae]QNN75636.1 thioredoxin-disulfide reductase [Weissella diestrammenae]